MEEKGFDRPSSHRRGVRDLDPIPADRVLGFLGISRGLRGIDRWGGRDLNLEINGRQGKYIPEGVALGMPLDDNLGVGRPAAPPRAGRAGNAACGRIGLAE